MSGKLKIQGNMGLALKLDKIPKVSKEAAVTAAPAQNTQPAPSATGSFRAEAVFDVRIFKSLSLKKL